MLFSILYFFYQLLVQIGVSNYGYQLIILMILSVNISEASNDDITVY